MHLLAELQQTQKCCKNMVCNGRICRGRKDSVCRMVQYLPKGYEKKMFQMSCSTSMPHAWTICSGKRAVVEDHVTLAFDEHDIHRYEREGRENLIKTVYDKGTAYRQRHMVADRRPAQSFQKRQADIVFSIHKRVSGIQKGRFCA